MEAIILAGGLGTRLRSIVKNAPKSMALIGEKPFLEYQLKQFASKGVTKFIFSVGYMADVIMDYFGDSYNDCKIEYAVEYTRLGTGGAIKNAMKLVSSENVIIANGDSLFMLDLPMQMEQHINSKADVTMGIKPMKNFERYGTVDIENDRVVAFNEKIKMSEGLINAGVYIFNVESFNKIAFPDKFSIEKDYFEKYLDKSNIQAFVSKSYFLDIGIPSDYKKAQYEFTHFLNIDKSWTLFLDRDGVINQKRDNDYVKTVEEFIFNEGSKKAIKFFSETFGRVIIVTNQQGIGKGIMTEDDLSSVHNYMLSELEAAGAKIDAVYHAPNLASENSNMRKPNNGMFLQAASDFPEIEKSKCIMIGDSISDMHFAGNAGILPVFINKDNVNYYSVDSLMEFVELLKSLVVG